MKLTYKKIVFNIALGQKLEKAELPLPLPFLFRSVIGKELRHFCCIAHDASCPTCMHNATCLYGSIFETIAPKDNAALTGRDHIPHPIIIETEPFIGEHIDAISLSIIFIGDAIQHIPYFFYALKKSGEAGILKARIPYTIQAVSDGARSILIDNETLDTNLIPDVWEYCAGDGEKASSKSLLVALSSPLRFKARGGRYTDAFSAADFAFCLHRRTHILCAHYGSGSDDNDYRYTGDWNITDKNIVWRDVTHYSARQKYAMKLGGVSGVFTLSGVFTGYERALLRFAELFHAGKNTNFGLGKISVWEKSL
jgi:hypothetical protein